MADEESILLDTPSALAIKLCHTTALRPCVLCGELTESFTGPDLCLADTDDTESFTGPDLCLADTDDSVCWDCGLKLAPKLMRLLGWYWRGRARAVEERTVTPSA